jgi:hypothetical protein
MHLVDFGAGFDLGAILRQGRYRRERKSDESGEQVTGHGNSELALFK